MRYIATLDNGRAIPEQVRSILCPVDFSRASTAALTYALELAEKHGAEVEVLHVWQLPSFTSGASIGSDDHLTLGQYVHTQATRRLEEFIDGFGGDAAARLHGRIESGDPVRIILDAALDASVIVMGAHRGGDMDEIFIGDVADFVVSDAPCPVITLRETSEKGKIGDKQQEERISIDA